MNNAGPEVDGTRRSRGAPRGPRPWPPHAADAADDLMAALLTIQSDAAGLNRQAAAIGRLTETCVEEFEHGNWPLAKRLLIDINRFVRALEPGTAGIGDRAQRAAVTLKRARAGEYTG